MAGVALRSNTQIKKKAARTRLQREERASQQQQLQQKQQQGAPRKKVRKLRKTAKKGKPFPWRLLFVFALLIGLCQLGFYVFSQHGPLCLETLKFPGRMITSGINGSIGAVNEGFNGVVETEQQFANQTFAHAQEDPLMIPVGIVSAAVAVPVGFFSKAPNGMMTYGQEGYGWWDEWFPPANP